MPPLDADNPSDVYKNGAASRLEDQPSTPPQQICFGLYEVNLQKCELRKRGLKLKVPHQSFQILAMLLERPGQAVSREELRQALWPSDVFVNFEGSLNSAVQRLRSALQDTSQKPRYIETLPKLGYRFIATVEAVTPSSTGEAENPAIVASPEVPVEATSHELAEGTPRVSRKARAWLWAAALFIAISFLASYVAYRRSHVPRRAVENAQSSPVMPPPVLPRRSVAIIGFANVSGEPRNRWLSTALTEMLATELTAGDQLRTIAQENISRAKRELSLTDEDSYAHDTLAKIRKDVGCDYVVTGSYAPVGKSAGGKLRFDARLQDAITGDTVANISVIGPRSDPSDLATRAGRQLRAKLGAGTLTEAQLAEAKVALPTDPEAAKIYSEGLARLQLYDNVAAKKLFEQVNQLQPDYAPAYSALATAWFSLGYDAQAQLAARRAMDLAHTLPPAARMQTEARYYEMSSQWPLAIEIYARLWQTYPDDLDYGLSLARAQHVMGSNVEAAATIAGLRRLPPPAHDDPRIDLFESGIAGELADYQRELSFAKSAAEKAGAIGARIQLARAKLMQGYAESSMAEFGNAMESFVGAQTIFAEYGNLADAAAALMNQGIVLSEQGDTPGGKHKFEQAFLLFQKTGDQASLAAAIVNIAESYEDEGNLPKAERLTRQSLDIFSKLNRKRHQDLATIELAGLLARQGKLREARQLLEPLVEHLRTTGDKALLADSLATLGDVSETQGDLPAALRMYQDAGTLFKGSGAKTEYANNRLSVGKAFLWEADFANAQRTISEALSLDHDLGAKTQAAFSQVGLAELALAQGGPVDFDALRSAVSELRVQKMTDEQLEAEIVSARALLQLGNTSEAARELREVATLSAKTYDPTIRFDAAIVTAEFLTAQHHLKEASRTAQSAFRSAVGMDCVRCQLEARLELGQIDIHAGNAERGRNQLLQLANDAASRGFNLIAKQAKLQAQT